MPKKGQKFQRYDRDLVLSIVQEKLQGDSSYTQLSKKYNIPEYYGLKNPPFHL